MSEPAAGPEFEKDVGLDKPGIVGARWWHRSLMAEDEKGASDASRRDFLIGMGVLLGGATLCCTLTPLLQDDGDDDPPKEPTSVQARQALAMQRAYGWDFGARGVPLVFDGISKGPFDRGQLAGLAQALTPAANGHNAKHHVTTLVSSLTARPTASLPDPKDGGPVPDAGAPFRPVADVLVPISTPAMDRAYHVGEALAKLVGQRPGFALVADLPGPEAAAFAAGAASRFEPVLLLDNWPHPLGVVPSHLTLAALAYYQPRFAREQAQRITAGPVFVLDRARVNPYTEQGDRFDNRYHARLPRLDALAQEGVRSLLYVVADQTALPEPADLQEALAAGAAIPRFEARAIGLGDFRHDATGGAAYARGDDGFREDYPFQGRPALEAPAPGERTTRAHHFTASRPAPLPSLGDVPVVVTASGLILAAAFDRQGSRNRFAGGYGA